MAVALVLVGVSCGGPDERAPLPSPRAAPPLSPPPSSTPTLPSSLEGFLARPGSLAAAAPVAVLGADATLLRSAFNRDRGRVRLLFALSPT